MPDTLACKAQNTLCKCCKRPALWEVIEKDRFMSNSNSAVVGAAYRYSGNSRERMTLLLKKSLKISQE